MDLIKTTFVLAVLNLLPGQWLQSRAAEKLTPGDGNNTEAPARMEERNAPRTIEWSTLGPNNGMPYSDAFARLTNDQVADLSFVVRVRRLIESEKIDGNGKDATEAAELARQLKGQGVDIDWLTRMSHTARRFFGISGRGVLSDIRHGGLRRDGRPMMRKSVESSRFARRRAAATGSRGDECNSRQGMTTTLSAEFRFAVAPDADASG